MTWSDLEELDFQSTPIGDISLRRRRDPRFPGIELYEVKLGDEFLMSSLFHAAEDALADYGVEVDRPPVTSSRIFDLLRATGRWPARGGESPDSRG